MGKLFRKFKIEKKKKNIEKMPKTKKLSVIQTHKIVKEKIENIFDLLNVPSRQNTGLRKILELDEYTLNINIYLVTRRVLELTLESQDELLFKILYKIISCEKQKSIHGLIYSYLEVLILSNLPFETLFNFVYRNLKTLLLRHIKNLLQIVDDIKIKEKLSKIKQKTTKCSFDNRIYFSNGFYELLP